MLVSAGILSSADKPTNGIGMTRMTTSVMTSVIAREKFGFVSEMQWSMIALAVVHSAQKSSRHRNRNVRKKPSDHIPMSTIIPIRSMLVFPILSTAKIRL